MADAFGLLNFGRFGAFHADMAPRRFLYGSGGEFGQLRQYQQERRLCRGWRRNRALRRVWRGGNG